MLHDAVEELISCLAAKMTLAVHFPKRLFASRYFLQHNVKKQFKTRLSLAYNRHFSTKTMLDRNDPNDSHHSKVSEDDVSNLRVDVCGCVLLCAMFE